MCVMMVRTLGFALVQPRCLETTCSGGVATSSDSAIHQHLLRDGARVSLACQTAEANRFETAQRRATVIGRSRGTWTFGTLILRNA
jgi:hypothetical protein